MSGRYAAADAPTAVPVTGVPTTGVPITGADIAAEAEALVAGLVDEPWGQVSASVYETGRLVALSPGLTGHDRRVDHLLRTQRPDGGWGSPEPGYALVPTLSATDALLSTLRAGELGAEDVAATVGLRTLFRWLRGPGALAAPDLPDLPAIELIVPSLVGSDQPAPGRTARPAAGRGLVARRRTPASTRRDRRDAARPDPRPARRRARRAAEAAARAGGRRRRRARPPHDPSRDDRHGRRLPGRHRGLAGRPGPRRAPPRGGSSRTPSAGTTARCRAACRSPSSNAPGSSAGWPARASRSRRPRSWWRAWPPRWAPTGTAAAAGLPQDADTTAGALYALALAGRPQPPDPLWAFEAGGPAGHFCTWPGEEGVSVSTNAHVLEAFGQYRRTGGTPEAARHAETVSRVAGWLRSRQREDGSWHDRWHASPYYATSCAALALRSFGGRESAAAVDRAVRWVLATQRPDGSWGHWAGTAEETAYAVQILLPAGGPGGRTPALGRPRL